MGLSSGRANEVGSGSMRSLAVLATLGTLYR